MKITNKLIHTFVLCSLAGFGSSALAQECPTIKEGTSQINVNDGSASLRKETNIDSTKGPNIYKDSTLQVISLSGIKNPEGQCWYKVKILNDTEEYWVQEKAISPDKLITPKKEESLQKEDTVDKKETENKQNTEKIDKKQGWLISTKSWAKNNVILPPAYLTSSLFVLLIACALFWQTNKKLKTIEESMAHEKHIKKTEKQNDKNFQHKVRHELHNLEEKIKQINQEMTKIQEDVKSFDFSPKFGQQSGEYLHTSGVVPDYDDHQVQAITKSSWEQEELVTSPSDTLRIIVKQFNSGNENYFNTHSFFFLKLTSATSLGSQGVGINALSKVEFERVTENINQASYIGFELDDQNTYLIPNLFNRRWKQVISSDENKIFECNGSNYLLTQPATIEDTGNGTWRLINSGRFQ